MVVRISAKLSDVNIHTKSPANFIDAIDMIQQTPQFKL